MRAWPGLVAPYLAAPLTILGTDGFGRSDTRAALRRFFEVDHQHIVLAALTALQAAGEVAAELCVQAVQRYAIEADAPAPWGI